MSKPSASSVDAGNQSALGAGRGEPAEAQDPSMTPFYLWAACRDGDAAKVREMLSQGADANRPPGQERGSYDAPILRASRAKFGSAGCVQALLEYGADPDARDDQGSTPAMNAARRGDAKCLAVLERVADLSAKNNGGMTALIWAAAFAPEGWEGCLDILLARVDPKVGRDDGTTALIMAAHLGRASMVEALIPVSDLGARGGSSNLTAAETAAESDHPEMAARLEAAEISAAALCGAAPRKGPRI